MIILFRLFISIILKIAISIDFRINLLGFMALALMAAAIIKFFVETKRIAKCRDGRYLIDILSDENPDAPKTLEGLCSNIYGDKYTKEEKEKLRELISCNIEPIKSFLRGSSNRKILCLNSKWGSGKTTSLMVAVDEEKRNLKNKRFIYESPFKYSGNVDELIDDLLETLEGTMRELHMITMWNGISRQLKNNLDSDPKNMFLKILKNSRLFDGRLSTELVYELNKKIRERGTKNIIFIIVDDLDRLHGIDIEHILGLLSILRRFDFIRIIIPADLNVICEALKNEKVVEPGKFIEKYLPVYPSVKIKSGYEMVEGIILDKIYAMRKSTDISREDLRPALAAIYLAILSEELKKNYQQGEDKGRYAWLGSNPSYPKNMNESMMQLLAEAPKALRDKSYFRSTPYDGNIEYQWDSSYNHIGRFQDIIYAIQKYNISSKKRKISDIRDAFSEEDYGKVVESWIFEFIKKRWNIFGFNIRTALDALNSIDCEKITQRGAKQFVEVHNMLFSDRQIKSSDDE